MRNIVEIGPMGLTHIQYGVTPLRRLVEPKLRVLDSESSYINLELPMNMQINQFQPISEDAGLAAWLEGELL